jgi:hypothetical protein
MFYSLGPCPNCETDFWSDDLLFEMRSKGRKRYSCVTCGQDCYPGGAINYRAMGGDMNTSYDDIG